MPTAEVVKTVSEDDREKIWADLQAKEAAQASGVTDPPSIETKETTSEGDSTTVTTTDAPADADAKDKSTAADDKSATDIWANASPELKAEYDKALAHAKRVGGTVAGYQRQVDKLQRELAEARKGAPSSSGDKSTTTSILNDPDWKKRQEEYPEIFGPASKAIETLERRAEALEQQLAGISEEKRQEYLAEQGKIVDDAHPDYDQIADSQEFYNWYRQAPDFMRAMVQRNMKEVVNGAETAHVLSVFKQETGWKPKEPPVSDPAPGPQKQSSAEKRTLQLESASGPRSRSNARVADGPPDNPEDAWEYWKQQDAKKAAAQAR